MGDGWVTNVSIGNNVLIIKVKGGNDAIFLRFAIGYMVFNF
ncbi:hypothetical protein [Limnobaculum eriocheiris]|nr:hypothetical protein [Limnobaculum eriocheiris]